MIIIHITKWKCSEDVDFRYWTSLHNKLIRRSWTDPFSQVTISWVHLTIHHYVWKPHRFYVLRSLFVLTVNKSWTNSRCSLCKISKSLHVLQILIFIILLQSFTLVTDPSVFLLYREFENPFWLSSLDFVVYVLPTWTQHEVLCFFRILYVTKL